MKRLSTFLFLMVLSNFALAQISNSIFGYSILIPRNLEVAQNKYQSVIFKNLNAQPSRDAFGNPVSIDMIITVPLVEGTLASIQQQCQANGFQVKASGNLLLATIPDLGLGFNMSVIYVFSPYGGGVALTLMNHQNSGSPISLNTMINLASKITFSKPQGTTAYRNAILTNATAESKSDRQFQEWLNGKFQRY